MQQKPILEARPRPGESESFLFSFFARRLKVMVLVFIEHAVDLIVLLSLCFFAVLEIGRFTDKGAWVASRSNHCDVYRAEP